LNSATIAVSDVKRSVAFYQRLFGMPVQAQQGETVILRVGDGPQFLAVSPASGERTGIVGFGLTVDNFNVDRLKTTMTAFGVKDVRVTIRGRRWAAAVLARPKGRRVVFHGLERLQCSSASSYGGGAGRTATCCCRRHRPPERRCGSGIRHMTFGGERSLPTRVWRVPRRCRAPGDAAGRIRAGLLTGGATPPRRLGRRDWSATCASPSTTSMRTRSGILSDNGLEPIDAADRGESEGDDGEMRSAACGQRRRSDHPLGGYELSPRSRQHRGAQIRHQLLRRSGANGQICP
jgi:catechol 2,3-dioxygenase-like lactoylglutathione lyase family enzyme